MSQFENPAAEKVAEILTSAKRIAVVGMSSKPERDSNQVARLLLERGYEVVPVNPREQEILGLKSYATLSDIDGKIDIVDIFRRSDQTEPIIDEAIRIGATTIWLQESVINGSAAERVREAGINFLQDICIAKELWKLKNKLPPTELTLLQ